MYSHILVPVSFEPDRDAAASLAVARALGAGGAARLTLLHVIEDLPPYAAEYLPAGYLDQTRADLAKGLAAMAADFPDAAVAVIEGAPGRAILDYAAEQGVDCIVIVSHRPGMQDLLLGSTAARIVRHATCSVHVVRDPLPDPVAT